MQILKWSFSINLGLESSWFKVFREKRRMKQRLYYWIHVARVANIN